MNLNLSYTDDQKESKIVSHHIGGGYVRLSVNDDVDVIASNIRDIDALEVACMGHTPYEALQRGLRDSDACFTAVAPNGIPVAMFGAGRMQDYGFIWLLGTKDLYENRYAFIKASRKYTQILTRPYTTTFNFVHKNNELAIKWLTFCKARFLRTVYFKDEPFYEFIIISDNV